MKEQIGTIIFCVLFVSVMSFGSPSLKYLPPRNSETFGNAYARAPSQQYLTPQVSKNLHYKTVSGAASSTGFERTLKNGPKQNLINTQIPIIRQDYTSDGSGNYNFGFQTANGIQRIEAGDIHYKPQSSLNVKGSYSYTGDDGRTYTVNYTADENGFHAEGDHLPTSPPGHEQSVGGGYGKHGSATYASRGYQSSSNSYAPKNRYLPPHISTTAYLGVTSKTH